MMQYDMCYGFVRDCSGKNTSIPWSIIFSRWIYSELGGWMEAWPSTNGGWRATSIRTFWQYSCMRAGRFIYQLLSFLVNTASFRQTQAVLAIGRLVEWYSAMFSLVDLHRKYEENPPLMNDFLRRPSLFHIYVTLPSASDFNRLTYECFRPFFRLGWLLQRPNIKPYTINFDEVPPS